MRLILEVLHGVLRVFQIVLVADQHVDLPLQIGVFSLESLQLLADDIKVLELFLVDFDCNSILAGLFKFFLQVCNLFLLLLDQRVFVLLHVL